MSDRLKKLGLLTQLREEHRELRFRADGILGSISDATFVRESPFHLDADRVLSYAKELRTVLNDGKALAARIDELKEELGVE